MAQSEEIQHLHYGLSCLFTTDFNGLIKRRILYVSKTLLRGGILKITKMGCFLVDLLALGVCLSFKQTVNNFM